METSGLLGRIVHSEEEAFTLYCDYGYTLGFSIRRGKNYYLSGSKKIRTKKYVCSKEGFNNDEKPNEATHNRLDTRTGCLAKIRFTVDEEGRWKVTYFNDEHNHEFATQEERHLLRSVRSVSVAKASVLDSMVNAGIRTINAYLYLAENCGGVESLELTKKDCYNYINKQKMMIIEAGDSQSLVNHFKCKANEEGEMFYWDMQLDHDG